MPPWPPSARSPAYVGQARAHARRARAGHAPPLGALAARPAGLRAPRHAGRRSQPPLDRRRGPARRASSSRCRPRTCPTGANGATDDYRCFLLDPKLSSDAFVTSARIAPGATSLVHHVILYRIGAGAVAEATRSTRARRARAGRASAAPASATGRAATRAGSSTTPAGSRPGRRAGAPTAYAHGTGHLAPRGQPDRDAGALQPPQRPAARPLARRAHDGSRERRADAGPDDAPPGPGRARVPQGENGPALRPHGRGVRPGEALRRRLGARLGGAHRPLRQERGAAGRVGGHDLRPDRHAAA